jgi:hypothetical protein
LITQRSSAALSKESKSPCSAPRSCRHSVTNFRLALERARVADSRRQRRRLARAERQVAELAVVVEAVAVDGRLETEETEPCCSERRLA